MPRGKPQLKVFRYDKAGMWEFMVADVNVITAAKRLGAPKLHVKRADLAEKDPDSAAVRLAMRFPATVWRRRHVNGSYYDYWGYADGEQPKLPTVELVVTAGTKKVKILFDYLLVYGGCSGQLSDKQKRDRWLDETAWDELKKSGVVKYALSETD